MNSCVSTYTDRQLGELVCISFIVYRDTCGSEKEEEEDDEEDDEAESQFSSFTSNGRNMFMLKTVIKFACKSQGSVYTPFKGKVLVNMTLMLLS